MNKLVFISISLFAFVASINCHGMMLDPVDRQSAWLGVNKNNNIFFEI